MTIEELIRILQTHPPDLRVVVDGYDDLEEHLVSVRQIRLDAGEMWWEGRQRDAEDTRSDGRGIVNALVLRRPSKQ